MAVSFKDVWQMTKATFTEWMDADPFRQSAIISYYAIFSMPGLLMIVIWVAGALFGEEAVKGELHNQVSSMLSEKAAEGVQDLMKSASVSDSNTFMKIVGIVALVFGATTLFFQLQKSLNFIWEVEADPENNFKKLLIDRASSLSLIMVIAFLLLITLVLSAFISILGEWIKEQMGDYMLYVVQLINFIVSLGIVTLLFAMMFKILPDVNIQWRTVWVGALVTALFFVIGKTLLGLYFGMADPSSSFGAAGTIILIMLWVNYTCLILFFGAQFTQVFARKYHHRIEPSSHARYRAEYVLNHEKIEREKEENLRKAES